MSTLTIQTPDSGDLKDRVARFQQIRDDIVTQVRRVIVGQNEVIEQVLIALFVGGHCLITGLPGTAKTLLVRTLATILGLDFRRIQFTPDLMPSDITGTDIIEEDPTTGRRTWTFVPGPIFANVLLADEINRTPPKTQSALLEAMQELSCTVRGNHYKIRPPFFVLATQNPIELEGTYPLPEAQLDRFIFNVLLDYLSADDEINRTPPKTQSALLEAMQELSCTVRGNHYKIRPPFFVLATQNPIELEGTYPLPEAQLDRFIFNVLLDYLSADDEIKVLDLTTTTHISQADAVTNSEEILEFQRLVRMVPIADSVARYAVGLVRATRATDSSSPDFVKKYVNFGASVRAAQNLVLCAKARALMQHRYHVSYEDVRELVRPILRHRILLNFQAESDKLSQDDILKKLLEAMPAPRE